MLDTRGARAAALGTYRWWSRIALRAVGARRRRVRVGAWSLVLYELGSPGATDVWILLHGLGSSALSWVPLARPLSRTRRLLLPELSSLGGSRGPAGGLGPTEGGAAVGAVLEDEGVAGRATVAGVSLGGWTALRLALDRPGIAGRLLLMNAGGYRAQDWDRIRSLVTIRSRREAGILRKALFARPPLAPGFRREALYAVFTSPAVTDVLAGLDESEAVSDEDLGRLRLPVGLVWGDEDGLFPPDVGRKMARAIPGASLFTLPECGHVLHWEDPEAALGAIEEWDRSTSDSKPGSG